MDGHFVPNITFGPAMCAAIRPHIKGVMDVHLMIAPVDPYIDAFAQAGADVADRAGETALFYAARRGAFEARMQPQIPAKKLGGCQPPSFWPGSGAARRPGTRRGASRCGPQGGQ